MTKAVLPWPKEALARLPWRQQMAVRMVYGDGLTQEAAAQRLGLTRATVASDLRKARAALGPTLST